MMDFNNRASVDYTAMQGTSRQGSGGSPGAPPVSPGMTSAGTMASGGRGAQSNTAGGGYRQEAAATHHGGGHDGRSGENNTGRSRGGDSGRGEHIDTIQEQSEAYHGVPHDVPLHVGGGARPGMLSDDISVISEISLDPGIMGERLSDRREESLSMISEENDSSHNQEQENSSRSNSSSYGNRISHTRTISDVSENQQSRVGAVSVGTGSSGNRLLERKLAGSAGSGSAGAVSVAEMSSGNRLLERKLAGEGGNAGAVSVGTGSGNSRLLERKLAGEGGNAGAVPVATGSATERLLARKIAAGGSGSATTASQASTDATGHVHFNDGDGMTARTQTVRPGSLLDQQIQKKEQQANAATHARSKSEGHQGSPSTIQGHNRTLTHIPTSAADDVPTSTADDGRDNQAAMAEWDERRRAKMEDQSLTRSISNDDSGTDRVEHVKGGGPSLLKRKEARALVAECSSCGDLIDALKRNSSSTLVVQMALPKLRCFLPTAHGIITDVTSSRTSTLGGSGSSKTAFPDGGWAKVLLMAMTTHSSDATIQAELLCTLWAIVTLPYPRYASDLISSDGMKDIVTTMETHLEEEQVQEYGCGLIACLASTDKHALRLLQICGGKFIHRLMVGLYFNGAAGNVQVNALKALCRLSSASLSSDIPMEPFASKLGHYIDGDPLGGGPPVNAIDALLKTLKSFQTNESMQIYGNRLLWNILSLDAIPDPDFFDILVGMTLKHIKSVMTSQQDSQVFHETIVCLLSKMSSFGSDSIERDADTFLFVSGNTMRAYPSSAIIALHGCRCLANVYSELKKRGIYDAAVCADCIPEIISCMDTFQEQGIMIQSEACAALSAICRESPADKERVQQLGGIDRIIRAYDSYSMSPFEDHFLAAKIRACVALTTLAVDPIILSDIREKGIIAKFEREEKNPNVSGELQSAIHRLLTLAVDAENMDQNLVFRDGASEEESCGCLRANIRVMMMPGFIPNRITYLRSNAVKAMRLFPESAEVHENACKLLACAFALASEGKPIACDEVAFEELEAVTSSLAHYKNIANNSAVACSALKNFCVMLHQSDTSSLNDLLSRSVVEVVNDLVVYRENEQNLKHATGALQALCAMREGLALRFETDSTVGVITGAMNRFPNSLDLQRHIVGILGSFFSVTTKIIDFMNDEVVTAILRFIQNEVDNDDGVIDYVDTAINILLITASQGFQGQTTLLRNNSLIDQIVSCMLKWPENLSIQSASIDILASIALDNLWRAEVCQRGGTSRVLSALDKLKRDPALVCKAYAALANLTSGADPEILRAPDTPAPAIMVRAMKAHPQNISVQVGAAHALWALSARSDSFKDEIVNLGGAEAVAAAMERFIGSKQMQAKGSVIIWSIAVPKHLKLRVGRCAVEPVVNGLSAHLSSERNCQDALGCLKCLSTLPANKALLDNCGAVDLIYASMWLHNGNPTLCKAALAALCNISVNVETDEVAEITSDDLEAVVVTMRTHRSIRAVQESAIILLRNFTFSPANIMILGQNQYVIQLIKSAMAHFNDHFDNRADHLLRVLPEPSINQ